MVIIWIKNKNIEKNKKFIIKVNIQFSIYVQSLDEKKGSTKIFRDLDPFIRKGFSSGLLACHLSLKYWLSYHLHFSSFFFVQFNDSVDHQNSNSVFQWWKVSW